MYGKRSFTNFGLYLMLVVVALLSASVTVHAQDFCPPLPAPQGTVVNVSNSSQLQSAINNVQPGTTIMVQPGTYKISVYSTRSNYTVRGATGNPDDVVIDNNYDSNAGEIINLTNASDVTIADLTLKRAYYHLIHLSGDSRRIQVYNVKLIDSREQFIKINQNGGVSPSDGVIACSHFHMTSAGRNKVMTDPTPGFNCYTGGIDAHTASGYHVRDNRFENIYCTNGGQPAEHAVHFWNSSRDTLVERNTIINCARGIGFGLGDFGDKSKHFNGIIRNNFICGDGVTGSPGHDCAICLENAQNVFVAHNSIYAGSIDSGEYNASIDHRFSGTSGTITNNIYTSFIRNRNSSSATVSNNFQASTGLWMAPGSCDLHIKENGTGFNNVVGQATATSVNTDIDGGARDGSPDIGADEFGSGGGGVDTLAPGAPENLRVP